METVKVYFNGVQEIRKFLWNFEDGYQMLVYKVKDVFRITTDLPISIRWKDEENDMIDLSTEEELLFMLNHYRQNDVKENKRLYVSTSKLNPSSLYEHSGVSCDGCEAQPLQGNRFKCLQCRNYDLCEKCFLSGCHRHHDMAVLRSDSGLAYHLASRVGRFRSGMLGSFMLGGGPCNLKRPASQECQDVPLCRQTRPDHGPSTQEELDEQIALTQFMQDLMGGNRDPAESTEESGQVPQAPAPSASVTSSFPNHGEGDNASQNSLPAEEAAACTTSLPEGGVNAVTQQMETCSISPEGFSVISEHEVPHIPSMSFMQPSVGLPPHIVQSRAQMLHMGFTDENGWLTEMLMYNNGDISKCLDAIQRRASRK